MLSFLFFQKGNFMNKYSYDGPVLLFNNCIENHFKAETYAASEQKARSNMAYQFKKKNNRVGASRISLPGKVTLIS